MKVLDIGHRYELANHNPGSIDTPPQVIQFIKKHQVTEGGPFVTVEEGTTNEEVLAMMIDRIQTLNAKLPCRENSIALTHIETALLWLNKRTQDRLARGVENTPKP